MTHKWITRLTIIALAGLGALSVNGNAAVILNVSRIHFTDTAGTKQHFALPVTNGFGGVGYGASGSATADPITGRSNDMEASIEGLGTGVFDDPTSLRLRYSFDISASDGGPLFYNLSGEFDTQSGELWAGYASGSVTGPGTHTVSGTVGVTLNGLGTTSMLPAGESLGYFYIALFVRSCIAVVDNVPCNPDPHQTINLDIFGRDINVSAISPGAGGGGNNPDPIGGDPAAAPEPATCLMLGLGLLAIGMGRRRAAHAPEN